MALPREERGAGARSGLASLRRARDVRRRIANSCDFESKQEIRAAMRRQG